MKKTRRSIIAILVMLATLLSFAAMPVAAGEIQRSETVQPVSSGPLPASSTHYFFYRSSDQFVHCDLLFTSFLSELNSVYVDLTVWQCPEEGFVSQYITDPGFQFYLIYTITVKYGNNQTATIEKISPWITLNNASVDDGYSLAAVEGLYDFDNISRVTVMVQVRTNTSTIYSNYWNLTYEQIRAQPA